MIWLSANVVYIAMYVKLEVEDMFLVQRSKLHMFNRLLLFQLARLALLESCQQLSICLQSMHQVPITAGWHHVTYSNPQGTSLIMSAVMFCGHCMVSVPLSISTQPERKSRLVGESVVLCCTALGNPSPQYYEWYVLHNHWCNLKIKTEFTSCDMFLEHALHFWFGNRRVRFFLSQRNKCLPIILLYHW
jgi:hypothetical protein